MILYDVFQKWGLCGELRTRKYQEKLDKKEYKLLYRNIEWAWEGVFIVVLRATRVCA